MIKIESLNKKEALRYLGYGNNEPDELVAEMLDTCEKEIIRYARPNFVYKEFDIKETEKGIEIAGTNLLFTGNEIKKHLNGCNKAILLCATVSQEVDKLLRKYQVTSMSRAVILDSLGSVAVEYVCNQAENIIKEEYPDKFFTWRYSPGYGDFPIETQRDFIRVLDAEKFLGVTVTDGNMLMPSKTVTAVIGVSDTQLDKSTRGCISCNMKDRCKFRAGGSHCGY